MRPYVLLSILFFSFSANARNLGVIGPLYPIQERDLLAVIEAKLKEKEKSGELAKLQEEAKKRAINSIEHPAPIAGITRATSTRTFFFDPTIVADKTYTDSQGHIAVLAGTRVNPFDYVNLTRHLIFFDARDEEQKAKALEWYRGYQGRVKLVLTGGSYTELMREWSKEKIRIYYDQHGRLVRHFGIEHVPAIVSQEGTRFRIDEFAI